MRTLTLYYDLARDVVSLTKAANAAEVTEIKAKLGDRFTLAVNFHNGGTSELLPTGSVLIAGAKPEADYQGSAIILVESDDWTVPTDADEFYEATVTLNTDELRALFTTSDDSENAHFEISHRPDLSTDPSSSQTIRFVIGQDVIRDNDSAPTSTGDGWTEADSRYQPLDADLTAIAALTTTSTGRSLLATANAAAIRTIAGLSDYSSTGFSLGGALVGTSGGGLTAQEVSAGTFDGDGAAITGLNASNIATGTLTLSTEITGLNVRMTHSTLTYGASVALDFAGAGYQTVTLTGVITFTTSNLAASRSKTIRIVGDSTARALTFPAGWTFVGAAAPASLAANKTAILTLTSFGTTDANVVAAYAAQP